MEREFLSVIHTSNIPLLIERWKKVYIKLDICEIYNKEHIVFYCIKYNGSAVTLNSYFVAGLNWDTLWRCLLKPIEKVEPHITLTNSQERRSIVWHALLQRLCTSWLPSFPLKLWDLDLQLWAWLGFGDWGCPTTSLPCGKRSWLSLRELSLNNEYHMKGKSV